VVDLSVLLSSLTNKTLLKTHIDNLPTVTVIFSRSSKSTVLKHLLMSGGSQTALSVVPFNLLNKMGRDVILIQLFKNVFSRLYHATEGNIMNSFRPEMIELSFFSCTLINRSQRLFQVNGVIAILVSLRVNICIVRSEVNYSIKGYCFHKKKIRYIISKAAQDCVCV